MCVRVFVFVGVGVGLRRTCKKDKATRGFGAPAIKAFTHKCAPGLNNKTHLTELCTFKNTHDPCLTETGMRQVGGSIASDAEKVAKPFAL